MNLSTTLLVLGWAALLSFVWAMSVFIFFRRSGFLFGKSQLSLMPALVISPLIIITGFALLGINLIFPAHSSMSVWDFLAYCFLPASVLFMASGLGFEIFSQVRNEFVDMKQCQFYLFATAMGQPIDRMMRRFVVTKGLLGAWVKCLPWFFGELVVVEAMFNAPGLGYHSWMYAKMRDVGGMTSSIVWLVGIYILLSCMTGLLSRWIGQRLEGYR